MKLSELSELQKQHLAWRYPLGDAGGVSRSRHSTRSAN